jgi:hypothetical protein
MMEHAREYRVIGRRLLRTLPEFEMLRDSGVRIAYLRSDEEKTKNRRIVFADCNRVNSRYAWCCPYDFFIVVYEPNVRDFTERQKEILIRHELHHVGIDFDGSEAAWYIVPHDVEEFWDIINECGLDWSDTDAERKQPEQP